MIEGYVGRPGSGKTYTLTKRILKEAEKRPVYSNMYVDHPNVQSFQPDELMDLPSGLVVIDEAHLWFPARGSLKLPMSWLAGMSQTRKKGWDILWTTQHENRVDRVVRDISNWMWLCSAWVHLNDHPMFFRAICWEPEEFRKPKRKFQTVWHRFRQDIADKYDTFEHVDSAVHLKGGDIYEQKRLAKAKAEEYAAAQEVAE